MASGNTDLMAASLDPGTGMFTLSLGASWPMIWRDDGPNRSVFHLDITV